MKKLISILFILSLVGCSKDKADNNGGNVQMKEANVFFTASDDLAGGISASQQTDPKDLNPTQQQIVEKLKPCSIAYDNTNSANNTTFSGDACPISYTQQTQMTNSEMKTTGDLTVKDAQFEKLVGFSVMKTTSSMQMASNDQGQQSSINSKSEFDSAKWKKGTSVSSANFNGQYVGDKNHMNFTMDMSEAVHSETINVAFTLFAAGKMVTDNNGNSNSEINSMNCTLNGAPIDCRELLSGRNALAKKSIKMSLLARGY